jgi:hypothetical protein
MSGNGVTLRRILKSTACAIGTVLAITAFATVGFISLTNTSALAAELSGTVQGAKQPIAGSTVTLFAAGTGAPKQLAQGKSDDSGAFALQTLRRTAPCMSWPRAARPRPQGQRPKRCHRVDDVAGNTASQVGCG